MYESKREIRIFEVATYFSLYSEVTFSDMGNLFLKCITFYYLTVNNNNNNNNNNNKKAVFSEKTAKSCFQASGNENEYNIFYGR